MAYLLGTDEAGYGPNLGPLVISATLWRVPDELYSADLYEVLAGVVVRANRHGGGDRLAIADSKALYKSGGGLEGLETGVLAALSVIDRRPDSWQQLFELLDADSAADRCRLPWYCEHDPPLPVDADVSTVESLSDSLATALGRAGAGLVAALSTAVFPEVFNREVQRLGSKGTALSRATLALVRRLIDPLGDEPIFVLCDKHGGRNKYAPLLSEFFPDYLVEIYGEGRGESVYRFGPPSRRVEIRFRAKGEAFLPSALASMISKYLRELAMRALNQFWSARVDNLKPTAGYPVDARRFKADIAAAQEELGIEDRVLWRCR